MWRLYTELREDGKLSDRLRAEHHTLVLFAIHQQSQITSMNWPGHSFGKSIRALLQRGRFSENALEDRFAATALTDSVDQLAVHVRGLVQLLRTEAIGLDYESVFRDLRDWQHPVQRHVVRRRWGSGFYGPGSPSTHPDQQSAQIEGVPQ
jgi:CRISPR system Cascade subunit CasB